MGKVAGEQGLLSSTFSHTNSLAFPIFKLPPDLIFQCYRPQTWQFYLLFPALSISGTHEVLHIGIKFKCRSCDP